ncbi:MAG TPA: glycoside hydrolase family 88 protein [Acidobacteriaceae bacterium]|nr:glycoside hydrolase family 88 protein [Acidobacteriaceae bacterium]
MKATLLSTYRSAPYVLTITMLSCFAYGLLAQNALPTSPSRPSSKQVNMDAGDSPDDPGPLETALSPTMSRKAIQLAMRKVADWQLAQSAGKYNQDWTYAPLYHGLLATSATTHDRRYHDAVLGASEQFQWKLWANRSFHADDEAVGQAYEILYAEHKDPVRIADTKQTFDRLLDRTDDPSKDLWWWCDALFMAPPAMAKLSALTGDHRYIDKMNQEWDLTYGHLYDPAEHLYFRDASFLHKTEANDQKLFWSRGNGWVLAGTANVLRVLPKNDPSREKYIKLFREMSDRIAGLQQSDGLWRTGLLDQGAYASPELSGSAFFTYAMTWGINEKILDRAKFGPVVEKAWGGMLSHIYANGRLGSIQPMGAAPGAFKPSSSYVYGVGGFLMAGSELDRYAAHAGRSKAH